MPKPAKRPVAVLGADSPIGLTVLREIGARGWPVLALGKSRDSVGRHSRYTSAFEVIAEPLEDWLADVVARHRPVALCAISEHHLIALSRLKNRLGDCRVLCPDPEQLAIVLDKGRTLELAARAGLDVPESWQPVADEDRAARAASLAYPVAVKWADPNAVTDALEGHGLAWEKVEYARNAGDLMAILDRYDPVGRYPLVQTWCAGEGLGQMLHMKDGMATLAFQHRRLREWPPTGGVSSFCEAVPPDEHREQMALSEALLREIGWQGPAMVEYRHDPATGRYWLMEVNGRFWGSIPLAYHCAAHFAWEQFRIEVLGESAGTTARPYRRRRARYVIPDAKHIFAVLRDPALPIGTRLRAALRFVADFLDPRVRYYVWTWRDPRPMLADLASIVRRRLF